jgi:hypothetical protein
MTPQIPDRVPFWPVVTMPPRDPNDDDDEDTDENEDESEGEEAAVIREPDE